MSLTDAQYNAAKGQIEARYPVAKFPSLHGLIVEELDAQRGGAEPGYLGGYVTSALASAEQATTQHSNANQPAQSSMTAQRSALVTQAIMAGVTPAEAQRR